MPLTRIAHFGLRPPLLGADRPSVPETVAGDNNDDSRDTNNGVNGNGTDPIAVDLNHSKVDAVSAPCHR